MFTPTDFDPVLLRRVRHEQPSLWPNHIGLVRRAHADDTEALRALDAELVDLAVRRRTVTNRLSRYRSRLWPDLEHRHCRRYPGVDEPAFPPAPMDATPLWGSDLRHAIVQLFRAHGELRLRELHGLLHLSGLAVSADRPVQRLADAAAFEVRAGRLHRVERGVYGPVHGPVGAPTAGTRHPWTDPDDRRMVDPAADRDPQRWSGGEWPTAAQTGSDLVDGDPDPSIAAAAEQVLAIRRRFAELIDARLGPPPPRVRHGSVTAAALPSRPALAAPDSTAPEPTASLDPTDRPAPMPPADLSSRRAPTRPPGHPPAPPRPDDPSTSTRDPNRPQPPRPGSETTVSPPPPTRSTARATTPTPPDPTTPDPTPLDPTPLAPATGVVGAVSKPNRPPRVWMHGWGRWVESGSGGRTGVEEAETDPESSGDEPGVG